MCTDVAALLNPIPTSDDGSGEGSEVVTGPVLQEREELTESSQDE
jgi:hypothetical protein